MGLAAGGGVAGRGRGLADEAAEEVDRGEQEEHRREERRDGQGDQAEPVQADRGGQEIRDIGAEEAAIPEGGGDSIAAERTG